MKTESEILTKYGLYRINRDDGMKHGNIAAALNLSHAQAKEFERTYDEDNKKDCSTCKYDGNQWIMPSGCTGCGVDDKYYNYVKKSKE